MEPEEFPTQKIATEVSYMRHELRLVPLSTVNFDFMRSVIYTKFTDPYFPPTVYAINGDKVKNRFDQKIQWRRPEQFLRGEEISIFHQGLEYGDIHQGALGNCWFMCVICALTQRSDLIVNLFENQTYEASGFYRISLCKNGEWQKVVVDDYIPCQPLGSPIFSRNNGPELWPLILEKAYAKMHGSYMSLKGGFASDAFIDLTGYPAMTYRFKEWREQIENLEFFTWLETWSAQGYCLVAATGDLDEDRTGMVANHYYSVTRVARYGDLLLVRLRNPWGEFEWKGDWSDGSSTWTQDVIEYIQPEFDRDDGVFWMSFKDFHTYFMRTTVGKVGDWHEWRGRNIVYFDPSMGGVPKYGTVFTVTQPGLVILGLYQEDERTVGVKEYRRYLDLGIALLIDRGGYYEFYASTDKNRCDRDVFLEVELQPGRYMIVPLSSAVSLKRPSDAKPKPFDLLTPMGDMHPLFQSTIKDIFRRFDHDLNQALNSQEFAELTQRLGFELPFDHFVDVICNKYTSTEEGITLQGLYELFMVGVEDKGQEEVKNWIQLLGYDQDFYSVESKPLVCTIHSQYPVQTQQEVCQADNHLTAWVGFMTEHGKKAASSGGVELYVIMHGQGASGMFHNTRGNAVQVTADFSKSQNVDFCAEGPTVSMNLENDEWKWAQHLQCMKSQRSFSYNFTMQVR